MTRSPTDTGPELIWLDPRTLAAHPSNIRSDLGDLSELAESIRAVGIFEPIVIAPTADGYRIIAGHRRTAAAIQADQEHVPCLVRADLTQDRDQLVGMLVENTRRAVLTHIEEARGHHQLTMAGVTQKEIARLTGTKAAHIRRSVAVARNNDVAEVAATCGLSLDQALELAEVSDDPEAVELLKAVAEHEPRRWGHVIARLRRDRQDAARHAAAVAELAQAGITVMDPDDMPETAEPLYQLRTADGDGLDPDAHQSCPGHVITLNHWSFEPDRLYCLDPAANGHQLAYKPRTEPSLADEAEAKEKARAERRAVIEGNRAWRAARDVRHQFVKTLISRKSAPKGTLRFVTEWIMTDPNLSAGSNEAVAELVGPAPKSRQWRRDAGPHAATEATEARLPLILLAQVAAVAETRCHDHAWRNDRPSEPAKWLTWLGSVGYTLSDIETKVATAGTKPARRSPRTVTVDQDDSPDAA